MDALRLPPADADVDDALGRRAAPGRAVPAAAAVARPAAARRADEPSRCGVGRLARTVSEGLRRHGRRRHARSLLSRQRRRLDSRARSRPRHSVGGQLLLVARAEAGPPRAGREGRNAPAADARARARMDSDVAARAAGQRQGAAERVRGAAAARTRPRRSRPPKSTSRRARGSATSSSRRADLQKGYGDNAADRRSRLHAAARRHRRRHRSERRRQDDAVPDDHRAGEAGRRAR